VSTKLTNTKHFLTKRLSFYSLPWDSHIL